MCQNIVKMVGIQPEKLHAACDECRTRKLKCSGDSPACSRCERESIRCVYSPQKPMGRPRKRRREDVQEEELDGNAELGINLSDFSGQSFGDASLMEQSGMVAEFPGFEGVNANESFSSSIIPPPYIESFEQVPAYDSSHGIDPIDPLLWDQQPDDSGFHSQTNSTPNQLEIDTGPCSCLSLNYLALSDLHALNDFAFPAVVPRLRPALLTASTMIHCPKCPTQVFSAVQNISALNSLLSAVAERFHKVLAAIDTEAIRLEQTGEKKSFRVGDNSAENAHLHTGKLDCPMGYDLQLDPQDWKKLAKKMLRTEVMGGGHSPTPLISLVDELEKRQNKWHNDVTNAEERARIYGANDECRRERGEEAMCLRMVRHIRIMIERMEWD